MGVSNFMIDHGYHMLDLVIAWYALRVLVPQYMFKKDTRISGDLDNVNIYCDEDLS